MKLNSLYKNVIAVVGFAVFALPILSEAQPARQSARQPGTPTATIEAIEINTVRTPNFDEKTHRSARSPSQDWFQYVVRLQTAGSSEGWLDQLTINWHVFIDGGATPRMYFTTSTNYIEIEDGETRHAATYIRPNTMRRYYDPRRSPSARNMVVQVEVLINNVVVAQQSHNPGRVRVPENWWRLPGMTRMENGLLAPRLTPFRWIDFEFYMTPALEN